MPEEQQPEQKLNQIEQASHATEADQDPASSPPDTDETKGAAPDSGDQNSAAEAKKSEPVTKSESRSPEKAKKDAHSAVPEIIVEPITPEEVVQTLGGAEASGQKTVDQLAQTMDEQIGKIDDSYITIKITKIKFIVSAGVLLLLAWIVIILY